jgi:hypothetical protein
MDAFIGEYQHVIAWMTYVFAGVVFCIFWWKLTRVIHHGGWRDLLRGLVLVAIYTPWYIGESHEHVAPAAMVLAMDLLLGSSSNGLAASLALLIAAALMLIVLIIRRLQARRADNGG